MIQSLHCLIGTSLNPYLNLATEEYLLDTVKPGQLILYLWQNERTVVIGKNQNTWKECRCQQLEEDGGFLARRLSGGGAVFHDLGNLNFTFLVPTADYDLSRQMSVILEAVRGLGIDAQKSGRNDVTVDGKKFSGNAFCKKENNSYHHGTLMLRVDTEKVSSYLSVSEKKLRSKGVASVSSRVCNLCDFVPQLEENQLDHKKIMSLYSRYSSWEWRFGRKIPFTWERQERFDWGEIQLQLQVDEGIIQDAILYADALDSPLIEKTAQQLTGLRFDPKVLEQHLLPLCESELQHRMVQDILSLTHQQAYKIE